MRSWLNEKQKTDIAALRTEMRNRWGIQAKIKMADRHEKPGIR